MQGTPRSNLDQNRLQLLYRFFLEKLQRTFRDLQLPAGAVLSYLADRLTFFARTDHLYRIQGLPAWQLETVVETLLALETARRDSPDFSDREEILVRRHVGDFTMFMTGIFRQYVERLGILDFYMREGTRSYARVAALVDRPAHAELFRNLSHGFEHYSGALNYMRKVYFYYEPADEEIRRVLRRMQQWG